MQTILLAFLLAHASPAGFVYPAECCGGKDCRALSPNEQVQETKDGFLVTFQYHNQTVQQFIPRQSARQSDDMLDHICTFETPAKMQGRPSYIRCFFFAPRLG